jgi:hypothetical protein
MKPRPFIRLFVPTFDPANRGKDGGGRFGATGTAYPVGGGLILTARHVVCPEGRDYRYRIKAYWPAQYDPEPIMLDGNYERDRCIAWAGMGAFDAALVHCPYPVGLSAVGFLSRGRPPPLVKWTSMGFPRAGKEEGVRLPIPFSGVLLEWGGQADVHLTTDGGDPLDADGWRGASGMPIFLGDTSTIVAVGAAVPPNFQFGRLLAAPTFLAYEDPAFLALGLDVDQPTRRAFYRLGMVKELGAGTRVLAELGQALRRAGLATADDKRDADAVVAVLLSLDIAKAVDVLGQAFDSVRNARRLADDPALRDTEAQIHHIARLLAAALYQDGVAVAISAHRGGAGDEPLTLPTSLPTTAEFMVASAYNRLPEFESPKGPNEFPYGARCLRKPPPPPEAGIRRPAQSEGADGDPEDDVRFVLARKLMPGGIGVPPWDDLREQIYARLIQEFVGKTSGTASRKAKLMRANNVLKRDGVYMLCAIPPTEPDRSAILAGLRGIREDLPDLIILGLVADENLETLEMDTFEPFRRMFE